MHGVKTFLILVLLEEAITARPGENGTDPTADLQDLYSDFWAWQMSSNPVLATSRGITEYNDRMEEYSLDQFDIQKNKTQEFLSRLETIDSTRLNRTSKLNFDVFNETLQTFLEGNVWARYGAVNPINNFGPMQTPYKSATADTETDFEDYIKRLLDTQAQMNGLKTLMRFAIRMNRTLHNVSMTSILPSFDAGIQRASANDASALSYQLNASTIEISKRESLQQRGEAAILVFIDAYKDLRNFISQEYLPNTRKEWGVWAVDETNGFYKACLNFHLSFEMDPAAVHSVGLTEVDRIRKEMNKTLQRIGFEGTVVEFYASVKKDERFSTNNASKLMQVFNDTVFKRIPPKLDMYFDNVPDYRLLVLNTTNPGYVAYNIWSSVEASGRFYVGIGRPNDTSLMEVMAVSLHEANPGHHLQRSFLSRLDMPEFRTSTIISYTTVPNTFPYYTAYIEGWGLYAEYLGEEMGLYETDYELMGRYTLEILRACRLVVDTGIHYMRWTRSEAVQYLIECTSWSRTKAEGEVDRYITMPGQACAYKIGEIKIRELRTLATKELGSKFDIKQFHKVVLENGAMSLRLLETTVKNWIKDEKTKPISAAEQLYRTHSLFTLFIALCSFITFL